MIIKQVRHKDNFEIKTLNKGVIQAYNGELMSVGVRSRSWLGAEIHEVSREVTSEFDIYRGDYLQKGQSDNLEVHINSSNI